jgi:hypothetical protein
MALPKGNLDTGRKPMHGVNLDLLRTLPHHPDGRPKNPHAHHLAVHLKALRTRRAVRWHAVVASVLHLIRRLSLRRSKAEASCL